MRVDVALGPADAPGLLGAGALRAGRDVVVIDVLRATSTILSALLSGCDGVRPVAGLAEAETLARESGRDGGCEGGREGGRADGRTGGAVLGGEREGLAPPGFDLGNSPDDYTAGRLEGRPVVLSTTNGTQAVAAAAGSRRIWAASLLNAGATCRALLAAGADDVLLLCAGTRGRVAADDVAAAGCMAGSLLRMTEAADTGDGARIAIALFEGWRHDLPGLLRRSESGRRLLRIGLERDIDTCARLDRDDAAVRLDAGGVFRLHAAPAAPASGARPGAHPGAG